MAVGEQHVVGLDIAVDHAVAVGVGERVYHFAQDLHRFGYRELALAAQLGAERLAGDERHDVIEQVAGGGGGEQRDDMRVLQPGSQLDLSLEALDIDAGAHVGWEDLDDDLTAEPGLLGEEDPAHPAATQFLQDAVGVTDRCLQSRFETDREFQVAGRTEMYGVREGWARREPTARATPLSS